MKLKQKMNKYEPSVQNNSVLFEKISFCHRQILTIVLSNNWVQLSTNLHKLEGRK